MVIMHFYIASPVIAGVDEKPKSNQEVSIMVLQYLTSLKPDTTVDVFVNIHTNQ